jgi:hypothetical protein
MGAPHLLPNYIPEKLLIREITYQTLKDGVTIALSIILKRYHPIFPIILGEQTLKNAPHAKTEAESLKYFFFVFRES